MDRHWFQAFRHLPWGADKPDKMTRFKTYGSFFRHDGFQ